jgi:hypothetical protein
MPLTLPTHPVAVLPLKLWRPAWFDGVALTIGAMSPDFPYALAGYGVSIHSHAWHAPLWWSLPVTLVCARVVRWAAPAVAAHLPDWWSLRDYGVLGVVRHPWPVTASSAVLGGASHLVWDLFTHDNLAWLERAALPGVPWWDLLRTVSDVVGFVLAPVLFIHIGRHLRRWHGQPPPRRPRPPAFWSTVVAVLVIGTALLLVQPVRFLLAQAIQALLIGGFALVAGAFAVSGIGGGPRMD